MLDPMQLNYLIFDYSEDTAGLGSFDAMASTCAEHAEPARAEARGVLAWAHQAFGPSVDAPGEDGPWSYELRAQREWSDGRSQEEDLRFDAPAARLPAGARPAPDSAARHTLTLTLSGTADFCAALRERFEID